MSASTMTLRFTIATSFNRFVSLLVLKIPIDIIIRINRTTLNFNLNTEAFYKEHLVCLLFRLPQNFSISKFRLNRITVKDTVTTNASTHK